jgi:hypothetical protein
LFSTSTGRWITRDPMGYHDGLGLYEYCNSRSVNKLDPNGLFSIRLSGDFEDKLERCNERDPDVQRQYAALAAAGCKPPDVKLITCTNATLEGYYDKSSNTIYICKGSLADRGARSLCKAIAHELQHAIDKCTGTNQQGTCADIACLELRASNLSGQCCPSSPYRKNTESYDQCVSRYAYDSSNRDPDKNNPGCDGKNEVDKQSRDKGCYDKTLSPCAGYTDFLASIKIGGQELASINIGSQEITATCLRR